MNLIRAMIEALNPCVHQYDVVSTLKDRPKNPLKVTVVRVCAICGNLLQDTIAPEPSPEPARCPPHKWETFSVREIFNGEVKQEGALPVAMSHEQRCEQCGDVRAVRLDWNRA